MSDSKTDNGGQSTHLSMSLAKALLDAITEERKAREQAAMDALKDESDNAHPYTCAALMGDVRQLEVLEAVVRRVSNTKVEAAE